MQEIRELWSKVSGVLDLGNANEELQRRLNTSENMVQTLTQQIEGLRSGNLELIRQLNSSSSSPAAVGKKAYDDTVDAAVRNLTAERERYNELMQKYQAKVEATIADERALINKIEGLKSEVGHLNRDNVLLKARCSELLKENVELKSKQVVEQTPLPQRVFN